MSDDWVYGIDCSFDELTMDEAISLRDNHGVKVFGQCLWTGNQAPIVRVSNLRIANEVGWKTIGYISVSPSFPGNWHVDRARAGIPDDIWDALTKAPIDVELPGLDVGLHVNLAHDRIAELGKPRDVYTNYNTWVNVLGNPVRGVGVGLWNAFWDNQPDIDFTKLPFGGWELHEVWGEQWSGGTIIEGQNSDQNHFRSSVFFPPEPVPPEPVPPTHIDHDIEALGAFQRAMTVNQRIVWNDRPSGLVEVLTIEGYPMEPRHFFYT